MKHSHYGASSANRWLNCPGSISLIKDLPAPGANPYALEGTRAHSLAEYCLKNNLDAVDLEEFEGEAIIDNMSEAVQVYLDYIREKSSRQSVKVLIETEFKLDHIHKGMFGTNDACVFDSLLDTLEVVDYKHGAGVIVSPEENEQLMYYGLGAAIKYDLPSGARVVLTIVQPRAMGDSIKSWETTAGFLYDFGEELRAGVERTKAKNPKLKEGDWCKFCPALAICPKVNETALALAQAQFTEGEVEIMSPEDAVEKKLIDISKVLQYAPLITSWFKAVESLAFQMANTGIKIDGYKLVKKRANRVWKYEPEELERILLTANAGKKDTNWFTDPKLKSPAQLERLFGKDFIGNLCESPDNGNTLVPISDKRQEVIVDTLEFEPVDLDALRE